MPQSPRSYPTRPLVRPRVRITARLRRPRPRRLRRCPTQLLVRLRFRSTARRPLRRAEPGRAPRRLCGTHSTPSRTGETKTHPRHRFRLLSRMWIRKENRDRDPFTQWPAFLTRARRGFLASIRLYDTIMNRLRKYAQIVTAASRALSVFWVPSSQRVAFCSPCPA